MREHPATCVLLAYTAQIAMKSATGRARATPAGAAMVTRNASVLKVLAGQVTAVICVHLVGLVRTAMSGVTM
jgi:hypothetical protein